MGSLTTQKDLVVALKSEIFQNVGILSKLQPMSQELTRLVSKENYLEKPTQNLFYHLTHYLVCIIDPQASASLSWPLYDTKSERAYKNELSGFVSDYSSKGLLSPVMSSYFVNPGCYKVMFLTFQLSQLAVQKVLSSKMIDKQKEVYNQVTEKYKSTGNNSFLDCANKETMIRLGRLTNYLHKRQLLERIAEKLRKKITDMETKLSKLNAQKFINDLIDGFLKRHELDESTKNEILKIKDVHKQSKFFDSWLTELDSTIEELESKWCEKMGPFINLCRDTQLNTESLISRHTGIADRSTYMIEYNHKTDDINTTELQQLVNSEQKYILKNIVKDEKLIFPNLIRGFLIAISFILKNTEVGDEIYVFNEYLRSGRQSYGEIVEAMRSLNDRVIDAEARLEPTPQVYHTSLTLKDLPVIPPLPDLTPLLITRESNQLLFDTFTPLNTSKHQFNLRRKTHYNFTKPLTKSLITPYFQAPKHDFQKSLISCRVSSFDSHNITQNFNNMSVISSGNRANETIGEISSGFTKEQILRLLSTKKSSSSKKFKNKMNRPSINIKKGGLFNETINSSNESNCLLRSHSSPNLYENRDHRSYNKQDRRKLSVMQEDIHSLLEVSGITAIEKDSFNTPTSVNIVVTNCDSMSLPADTPTSEEKFHNKLKDFDLNKEIALESPILVDEPKVITPKNHTSLITKTSSLEKIINRFKKVRATILPEKVETNEFHTIREEKENITCNIISANRILLPDLLSPSCSVGAKTTEYDIFLDDTEEVRRKPRESLGTMLGVDQTFLDEFDLID